MRKYAAAALALPILALVYGPILVRRVLAGRVGVGIGSLAIAGIVTVGLAAPGVIQARPPVTVTQLGSASLAGSIEPHHALREPVRLSFSAPMDAASVAAALTVEPATPVDLTWDAAGSALTIAAAGGWKPGTYYSVTVAASARDRNGTKLAGAARSIFTTRAPLSGQLTASTTPTNERYPTTTTFSVAYDGSVDVSAVEAAFHIDPTVAGTFTVATDAAGGSTVTFVPIDGLALDTAYTVTLLGDVRDGDGIPTTPLVPLAIQTVGPVADGPTVVRFRPFAGSTDIPRGASLSVRFTARMDRTSTAAAFSAKVGTAVLKGKVTWAEKDTVLVFQPTSALPYGAKVVLNVASSAMDVDGNPLKAAKSSIFSVGRKPTAAVKRTSVHIGHGSSVGAGSWHAVEVYYLKLMNCTRGGGWITPSGNCSSPGGSGINPLILNAGISTHVSRPYAKYLVSTGICSHFADGNPGDRLRRAGYAGDYRENLGCRSAANAFASVLGTHLYFQSEKPCGGYCHYANIMSTKMKYVGIGVWVGHGRVRLVIDFWEG